MVRVRSLSLGVVAALTAACSFLVDTGSLGGGDEGVDGTDAGGDAGRDVDVPAPVLDAAAADARDDEGAAPRAPCTATFCDDFDLATLGAGWGSIDQSGGATLTLVEGGVSAPFALHVELPARSVSESRSARLTRTFPFAKRVDCAFAMRAEELPDAQGMTILGVFPRQGPDDYTFRLRLNGYSVEVREGFGATVSYYQAGVAPRGQWTRVRVVTDFATATVTVDQAQPQTFPLRGGVTAPMLQIALGESGDTDLARFSVLLDDFACTLTN